MERVGTRSDLYSLGAMLYALLAGSPPYMPRSSAPTSREVLERVRAGPPEPLSRAAPEAPPELAAICEKAMARDPGSRYPSVSALAGDLRAFLEHRVVGAYKTGAIPELRKWVRRNRAFAGAAAAAALALVVGLTASLLLKARADRNAEQALAQSRRAGSVRDFLARLIGGTDFDEAGRRLEVVEVLQQGRNQIQVAFANEPELEAEVRRMIGVSLASMSEHREAIAELREALQLQTRLSGPEAPTTLETQYQLGRALAGARLLREAREVLEPLLAAQVGVLGESNEATLKTMYALSRVLKMLWELRPAETMARRALELSTRSRGGRDQLTIKLMYRLSDVLAWMDGDWTALRREAADLAREKYGVENPLTLYLDREYAAGQANKQLSGQWEEAERELRRTLAVRLRLYGPDDFTAVYWSTSLGTLLHSRGYWEEGRRLLEEGLEDFERIFDEHHIWTGTALRWLAQAAKREGDFDEAVAMGQRALDIYREQMGPEHGGTIEVLGELGWFHHGLGRESRAAHGRSSGASAPTSGRSASPCIDPGDEGRLLPSRDGSTG